MEVLNQPITGQLGNRLIQHLNSGEYQTLNIVVAFAKNSGVLRIKSALEAFRERGGTVNVYVGVDLEGTSYEALTTLLMHTNSLHVVHAEKWQTFHPKIYYFQAVENSLVIIGSNNLTGGGLWTNFESSVIIPVDGTRVDGVKLKDGLDDYIGKLSSLDGLSKSIESQLDIDALLENGYIFKEVAEKVRRATSIVEVGDRVRLFGTGIRAKLPSISKPFDVQHLSAEFAPTSPLTEDRGLSTAIPDESHPIQSVLLGGDGETIWFETRRMTGGSRNILDLSMKSLVESGDPTGTSYALDTPQFMKGGVEFFGLNPSDIASTKTITINFDGIDYVNNTILYPKGEKANGTWRLQIKGATLSGKKITEALRHKGVEEYLVNKILTFTKVDDDYYYMSVFPESEIEIFMKASQIVAHNGSATSARLLGLL